MMRCLNLNPEQLVGDQRNVKDLFSDWSHMSLKTEVIKQMQDIYEKKFNEQIYKDTGNDIIEDSFDNDVGD